MALAKQTFRNRRRKSLLDRIVTAGDRAAFSWKIREGLYRHLSAQVSKGVSTEEALDKFRSRLQRRKKVSSDKIVAEVSRRMRNGSTLADAMSTWLPKDEIAVVSSGELSGSLPKTLEIMIESKRRVERVKKAFKSAMFNPAIYGTAFLFLLWVIGNKVTPGIKAIVPPETATGLVRLMFIGGDLANSWWIFMPVVLVAGIAGAFVYYMPRWTGKYRIAAEEYFPFSFYRDIEGYTWLMSFLTLLRAGKPDVEILSFQSKLASPWLYERLHTLWWRLDSGESLSSALLSKGRNGMPAFGFPNPDIVDDITSLVDFHDFPEKAGALATEWAGELEVSCIERAKWVGVGAEVLMYLLMGMLFLAINDLSNQLGSVRL